MIKAAKAKYLCERLSVSDNISRDAWRMIDSDRRKKPVSLPKDMPSVEAFNDYFSNVGKQKQALVTEPLLQPQNSAHFSKTLFLRPSDPHKIYHIIMQLKNSNSAGYDMITHKVVRHCAKEISYPISEIINSSLSCGIFPQVLKQTIIRPIFKDGNSSLPESWRPIANVSTFSKIYEHVFAQRLLDFLLQYKLLCKDQYGFVKGKSTIDAMVNFATDVIQALDNKFKTVGVFLDLQKAFDCIVHGVLLDRLYDLGVRGPALNWVKSFIENRSQRVKINNSQSEASNLNFGIPQGSILGPILYILYTNNINKTLPDLKLTMYADDIALIFKNNLIPDLKVDSFLKLTNLYQFLNSNNLHVNPNKSSCLLFSTRNNFIEGPLIIMIDFELPNS